MATKIDNRRFVITDRKDGSNVLGGPIGYGNCYVSVYPSPLPGYKHPAMLEVGESTRCEYRLSGSKGIYTVSRLENAV